MKKLLFISSLLTYSYSQDNLISDGPYIFIDNGNLIEKEIIDNQVFIKTLKPSQFDTLFYPSKSIYKNVSKIAALSDIHGQYDLFITLLMNNEIIDKNLNWIFGKGHLVINGDIFDRGEFDKYYNHLLFYGVSLLTDGYFHTCSGPELFVANTFYRLSISWGWYRRF